MQNDPHENTTASFPVCVQWIDSDGEERATTVWATVHKGKEQVEGIPILNIDLRPEDPNQEDGRENEEEEKEETEC